MWTLQFGLKAFETEVNAFTSQTFYSARWQRWLAWKAACYSFWCLNLLKFNKLRSDQLTIFWQLVSCESKGLRTLPLYLPNSARKLTLANNNIMEVRKNAFRQLVNLVTLKLNDNRIRLLPVSAASTFITLKVNLQDDDYIGIHEASRHHP